MGLATFEETALAAQLIHTGRSDVAVVQIDRALQSCPLPEARSAFYLLRHVAMTFLHGKDSPLAWADLGRAWADPEHLWTRAPLLDYLAARMPLWHGEYLSRRPLLIIAASTDQFTGDGDIIFLARYLESVCARAGRIVLALPPCQLVNLAPLLGHFELCDWFRLPDAPAWLPLELVPLYGDSASDPYLWARPRPPLFQRRPDVPCVAISWAGSTWVGGALRDVHINFWAPLLRLPGIRFVSLQKPVPQQWFGGPGARSECGACPPGVEDLAPKLRTWGETAAVLTAVDLLICTDSGIAHVAGALGVPTWVLLRERAGPFWPKVGVGETTPLYGSLRLFRSQRDGEWDGLIPTVRAALERFTAPPAAVGAWP